MNDNSSLLTCVVLGLLFAAIIAVSAWSVNYLLLFFFNKTIPFLAAVAIAIFGGEVTVPLAVVIWILHSFGVI